MLYVAREIGTEIVRSISRLLQTNPRARFIALAAGIVFSMAAVMLIVSALMAPRRNTWGSVSGYVKSVSGDVLPGAATITFIDQHRGAAGSAEVGSNGYFEVQGVQDGQYAVFIEPIIPDTGKPLTRDDVEQARDRLAPLVPVKFQSAGTSGIVADLKLGRNRFDVDLTMLQ